MENRTDLGAVYWLEMKGSRWLWLIVPGILGGGAFAILKNLEAQYVPRVWPPQTVAGVPLSGSPGKVKADLDNWWNQAASRELALTSPKFKGKKLERSLADLGVSLDTEGLSKSIRMTEFWPDLIGAYGRTSAETIAVNWHPFLDAPVPSELAEFVKEQSEVGQDAKVVLDGGEIKRTYEGPSFSLVEAQFPEALAQAVDQNANVELPLEIGKKKVPDEELDRVKKIIARFSTTFNNGQYARSSNIRLAASRINGLVLMPGDSFSFNGHLGQRTPAKGFKEAGVYVNGRHDTDVGGGICQVSTTLYNAVMIAGLKTTARSPHSLPVPYVPLGRDAAVSFPNPDLKFVNDTDAPVALAASVVKGKIEFAILGEEKLDREVKFETRLLKTWSHGEKFVDDPSLPPGKTKLVDKGGSGRSVRTWKVIYEDGKEVKRIDLGISTYRGGPRIYARNNRPAPPKPTDPVEEVAPTEATPPTLPTGG